MRSPRRTRRGSVSAPQAKAPRDLQFVVGFLVLLVLLQAYPSALVAAIQFPP